MLLQDIKDQINQEIAKIRFGEDPGELYEPMRYIMQLGGKRMRPCLTLLGHYLFEDDPRKALRPAIGVEVFHNFTLMHDDIMDKAPLRRGKPTVHTQWNENIAILSGDVMLIQAYHLMMEVDTDILKPVVNAFGKCATEVCEGQQFDMNFEQLRQISEQDYLDMIMLKTAVLLGFSLELGGLIARASEDNLQNLREFGIHLGIGFQLKDDLLDVYGDASKFGKMVGGDIVANKKTFLLTKALEIADGSDKEELVGWLDRKEADPQEKVQAVTQIYNKLCIREHTLEAMNTFFEGAFEKLDSVEAAPERKEVLRTFAQQIIDREK